MMSKVALDMEENGPPSDHMYIQGCCPPNNSEDAHYLIFEALQVLGFPSFQELALPRWKPSWRQLTETGAFQWCRFTWRWGTWKASLLLQQQGTSYPVVITNYGKTFKGAYNDVKWAGESLIRTLANKMACLNENLYTTAWMIKTNSLFVMGTDSMWIGY